MTRTEKLKALVKLYKTLYWKYKFQMAVLSVLGIVSGFLSSLGIVIMIPLLAFAMRQNAGQDSTVSMYVEKVFHYFNFEPSVKLLLIGVVAIFIFKAAVLSIFDYIGNVLSAKIGNEIRKDYYARTLNANWSYLADQKISHLDYAINIDIGTTLGLINKMYDSFINLTSFIAYAVTAFALSFYVTSLALAVGAVILYATKYMSGIMKHYANKSGLLKRDMSHNLNEIILGLKAIKTTHSERQAINIYADINDRIKVFSLKLSKMKMYLSNPIEPLTVIFVAGIFAFAYKQPGFNFAAFLMIIYLIQRIFIYTDKFQATLGLWNNSLPAVERIMALSSVLDKNREKDTGRKDFKFEHSLEFQSAAFAYASGTEVFKNLALKIKKGETAGIVGPSGSGKTTIADLIIRLFPVSSGRILLDGDNIENFTLESWRKNIGYVSQDVFLKDGTIEENIRFYDVSVTDKDIENGARSANIYDFILSLPDGFKTQVGDRGMALSTGQRQRIALARVLSRHPQILILDEATSSLDNESESLIKESIEKLRGAITIIIIAHRLTTVMGVDHLIALKDGQVVEEGDPKALLEDQNSYFHKVNVAATR